MTDGDAQFENARRINHEKNLLGDVECRSSFSITRMDDVWYLWHAAKPPGIDRVVSVDGIPWIRPASKPLRGLGSKFVSGQSLKWDDKEIVMPYALRSHDYHLGTLG